MITCGEALIKLLELYGVDTVFGIPGVHTLDLYRGLAQGRLRHVLARNEQGAGFMADGYARVSGRPGVCILISGPGVTNAATPLGQSYADSVPVLLISSVATSRSLGKGWGCLHEITNQEAVTKPLTALSATAMSPEDLPELFGQAFSIFESGRPRPVHIAIPTDVLGTNTNGNWARRLSPNRPAPNDDAVRRAAEMLQAATRLVVLVGGGAAGASTAITALVDRLSAPVISSNAGKGVVPESHALSLGGSMVRAEARALLSTADVVLAVGTEISETDSFVERVDIRGKLIRIDIDPRKINDLYPAHVGIVADAKLAVEALLSAMKQDTRALAKERVLATISHVRQQITNDVTDTERQHIRLLAALRKVLPSDTVVMGDIAQLVYTGSFAFPVEQPRLWHYPAGYCTLGCGLPNGIGAKLALPDRPVIVLVGDGGFMFTVQELVTAAELGLSLPIVLWNNGGLKQIRDDMFRLGIEPIGVSGTNPDFVALAQACGCEATRADSVGSFSDSIRSALRAGRPTVIEVCEGAPWLL